jgi:hypothetical protein
MVTILSAIGLYLMVGVLAAALIFSGPEKHQSYIDLWHLVFIIILWPTVGAWYLLSSLESPHFRNPFWSGGKQ